MKLGYSRVGVETEGTGHLFSLKGRRGTRGKDKGICDLCTHEMPKLDKSEFVFLPRKARHDGVTSTPEHANLKPSF